MAADLQQIRIPVDQNGLEPALEQMSHLVMLPIEGLGVDPANVADELGKISSTGVQHDVVVIAHQAKGKA
jgi:hypothetical protein